MYAQKKKESPSQATDDRVSVVMITHNRGKQICTPLDHLLALPEKPQGIVVDNASTDETLAALQEFESNIEVVHLNRKT